MYLVFFSVFLNSHSLPMQWKIYGSFCNTFSGFQFLQFLQQYLEVNSEKMEEMERKKIVEETQQLFGINFISDPFFHGFEQNHSVSKDYNLK